MSEQSEMHLFAPGHAGCPGCAPSAVLIQICDALGKDIIVVNATGCMEITSSQYPHSAWRVPYIHSLFENAPAVASGISAALRAKGNNHTLVACIAGDGSCYSSDTKIFTSKGFRPVSEIQVGDKIWSVNPKIGELELQPATKLHQYFYEGKMIRAKTRYVDFCVTPDHSVPILSRYSNIMKLIKAKELLERYKTLLPRSFKWKGTLKNHFCLPVIENRTHKKMLPKFRMKDWVEFIGWYVAEGSAYYNKKCGYLVRIYQSNKENRKRILALTRRMGLHSIECNRSVDVSSKQLFYYLKENCGAYFHEKRIPTEFLELTPEMLEVLFDALIAGDGSKTKTKNRTSFRTKFITKSNYLLNQFIEICLKLGKNCSLRFRKDGVADIGVQNIHVKNELYSTRIFTGNKPQVFEEEYEGFVYCPELPKNHTLIIERNGKISLSGNSYDIGFGALSGMLERGDDVLYIVYDNELYANTGVQKSGATPFGAATTTSQVGIVHQGNEKDRKPIVEIAAAHNIPYAASASIAFLADFKMKLKKAAGIHGSRFITVHAPCCLGAGFDGGLSMKVARLAVQSRQWFLFEIEKGKFKLNFDAKAPKPVGDYLGLQKRFAHVTPETEAIIQKKADKNYERFVEWHKRDNPVLQPAQPTVAVPAANAPV